MVNLTSGNTASVPWNLEVLGTLINGAASNTVTVNVANWLATNVAKVYASAQGADDGQP